MKAAAISRYKAPLEIVDLPRPEPGPNDLLVRVRAASVNPVDFKIRDGALKPLIRYRFPSDPGLRRGGRRGGGGVRA
jgi:alcohol dehydrogenase